MSRNQACGTSQSVVIVPQNRTIAFPENAVFIRRLQTSDAREIAALLEVSEYAPEPGDSQFGIFTSESMLVGLYETSEEAFIDSQDTDFVLQWMH